MSTSSNQFAGAVGSGKGTVENNTWLYELTLPEGVTADGAKLTVGNNFYVTEGKATLNYNGVTYNYEVTDNNSW